MHGREKKERKGVEKGKKKEKTGRRHVFSNFHVQSALYIFFKILF